MRLAPSAPGSLELRAVTRSFGRSRVLDAVDLDAGPGSILGVAGENGAGKTTLLRLIAGTLLADSGSVRVCGTSPGSGMTGYVPAGDRGLYWRITVRENLRFAARVDGVEDVDAAVNEIADRLQLRLLLDKRVEACSTGQRRRVLMARAAIGGAPVLLFDEPFEGLDEAGTVAVVGLVEGWAEAGGLVVWAAPNLANGPTTSAVLQLGVS